MKTTTKVKETAPPSAVKGNKPGLLGRLIRKLDERMKAKAEQNAAKGGCCCSGEDKGGPCS